MNRIVWLIFCQLIQFGSNWELPPAQFLIDFANLHFRKSIIIYLPEKFKNNIVNWNNIFNGRYSIDTIYTIIRNIKLCFDLFSIL